MVVTLLPTAFAAENSYSDTQGHWGEDAIDRWSGYGVISGTGSGLFDPNAPLTRAQAAQIFANLLNLSATASVAQYTDVAVGSWYYDAIAKCVAAGILNGTGSNTMSPNTYVSREELFVMFARALGIQPQASAGVTFTDSASTASWAAGYVNALADMGVVGGSGDGTLAPKADIDRASVVALLDKAITAYGNTSGATVGSSSGIVLVVADNVTVMGSVETLVVAGGSAGISGSTVGTISVVGESASVSVGGSANVGQVSVTGANASVTVRGEATVSGVTIADTAQGAELTVSGDATVTAVDSAAQNVTISGDGTIEAATVSGDNTTVDTNGTDLTVSEGTTGVTENDRNVSAGDTVVTEPAEDTGSSGESTTPSRPTNPSRPSYDYYTVTFMLDENTVYDTQRVREGSTVEQPVAPTKDGYRFDGWYLDGAVVAYDFTAPVENDITLTARWLANPVTVTLVEGQNIFTYQTEYGTTLNEATLNAVIEVERPYETVTGWWIDIWYNTKYDFTTVVTGDMTLYYRCQGKEYTVTFVIADAQPEAVTDAYGTPVTLPTSTDDAYTWTWYEDEAFTKPVTILSIPGGGLTLYGQWTHKESGLKGHGSEADPFQLSTAQDIDHMISSSTTTYYYEMLNDIELTSDTVQKRTYGVNAFNGVLNGNNHTLSGLNQQETYYALFYQTYGNTTIQNLTIDYNCQSLGSDALLVFNAGGTLTFENVTTSGYIEYNYNGRNQSPFMYTNTSNSTVTFSNCVNECNIYSSSGYNSAFVGYSAWGNNSTFNFVNCVNRGELRSKWVAVFFGNPSSWGSNVTINITNCSNEGTVIGTERAGLFCWGASGNLTEDALNQYNNQITNKGTCEVNKLDGFSAAVDDDGQITITRESSDTSNVAYYSVAISLYTQTYNENGVKTGTDMFAVEKRVDIGDAANGAVINTGIYRYDFRQLASSELTGIASAANITLSYAVDTNNYTVVTSDYDSTNSVDIVTVDETMYYLFKDSTAEELGYSILTNASPAVTVYAYDASGKLLGSVSAQ